MSRETLERAFEPFFTTKPRNKGTGLGLAMVYATVKAHGGHLKIQSEPGLGTSVTVQFPIWRAAPAALASLPPAAFATGPAPLELLLIDDDELVRHALRLVLETTGHRFIAAASGEEALALLAGELNPDVIVLDMNMPGLSGHKTLPRIRALRPTVPVLLATGHPDQSVQDLIVAHTRVALLPKPFTMDEFRRSLGQLR
jgi:CheY-like chemotaxis protein